MFCKHTKSCSLRATQTVWVRKQRRRSQKTHTSKSGAVNMDFQWFSVLCCVRFSVLGCRQPKIVQNCECCIESIERAIVHGISLHGMVFLTSQLPLSKSACHDSTSFWKLPPKAYFSLHSLPFPRIFVTIPSNFKNLPRKPSMQPPLSKMREKWVQLQYLQSRHPTRTLPSANVNIPLFWNQHLFSESRFPTQTLPSLHVGAPYSH